MIIVSRYYELIFKYRLMKIKLYSKKGYNIINQSTNIIFKRRV